MKPVKKKLIGLAVASVLGATTTLSVAATTATDEKTGATKETSASTVESIDTTTQKAAIGAKAVHELYLAMSEIRNARLAIFDGSAADAEKLIGEAHRNLLKAQQNLDGSVASTKKKTTDGDSYVAFDVSLMLSEGFVPTPDKNEALGKANKQLAKGEHAKARETLKLARVELGVSAAMIPVMASLAHAEDAVKLAGEKQYYEANLALKAIEDSVIVESYDLQESPG